jgi:HSP20 family protein
MWEEQRSLYLLHTLDWDRELDDWLRCFFSGRIGLPMLGRAGAGEWLGGGSGDTSRQFEQMRREGERALEDQFRGIESAATKDLVREYQTPEGTKVREVGPLVYGYSMTIGPDGKPKVREFGNVRATSKLGGIGVGTGPSFISGEREPLADMTATDKEVKVILEMPGVTRKILNSMPYDNSVK